MSTWSCYHCLRFKYLCSMLNLRYIVFLSSSLSGVHDTKKKEVAPSGQLLAIAGMLDNSAISLSHFSLTPLLSSLPMLSLPFFTLFLLSLYQTAHAGSVGKNGTCSIAHNRLQAGTFQFFSDCDAVTFCNSDSICVLKTCRKDDFPFGYKQDSNSIPPKCEKGEFCPDEGSGCQPVLAVGSPCQLNRDGLYICRVPICIFSIVLLLRSMRRTTRFCSPCRHLWTRFELQWLGVPQQSMHVRLTHCTALQFFICPQVGECNSRFSLCSREHSLYRLWREWRVPRYCFSVCNLIILCLLSLISVQWQL